MAAAPALEAEGVLMGTRSLASDEAPVHTDIHKALLKAKVTGRQLVEAGQVVGLDSTVLPVAENIKKILAGCEDSIQR